MRKSGVGRTFCSTPGRALQPPSGRSWRCCAPWPSRSDVHRRGGSPCNSPRNGIQPHPMREIVLDTETTGLDCLNGDRLIEIGCLELLNHIPTGRTFHAYINPRRSVSSDALAVHGLSDDFL